MKEAVCYNILYLLYSFLSFLTSLIIYFCISFLLLLWHQWSSSVSKFLIDIHNQSSSATHICVRFMYNHFQRRVVFSIVNFILYLLRYKYIVLVNERSCMLYSFIPSFHYVFYCFDIKVSSLHSSTIICSIIIYNVYIIVCLFYHKLWEYHLFIYLF